MLCPKWNRPWQKKIEATIRSECELPHKFAWKHSRFQTWQHTAASTQKRSPPTNSFIAANQWRIQKSLQVTRTEKNRNSKDDSLNPTNDARLFHSPWHHAPMDQDRQTEHAKNVDAKYHDSHTHDPSKPFINSDVKRLGHEDTSACGPPEELKGRNKAENSVIIAPYQGFMSQPRLSYLRKTSGTHISWGRVVYLSYRPLQVIQVYAHNILHRHRAATDLFCCRRDSCKQIEVGPRSLPTQFCKCIGRRHHAMSATTAMLQSLVLCLCDLTGTRQVSFSEFFVVH